MSKRPPPSSKLDAFIRLHGLKPAELASVACVSRQHLLRVRTGKGDPTRQVMVRLVLACTSILHSRVSMEELFDLEDAGL